MSYPLTFPTLFFLFLSRAPVLKLCGVSNNHSDSFRNPYSSLNLIYMGWDFLKANYLKLWCLRIRDLLRLKAYLIPLNLMIISNISIKYGCHSCATSPHQCTVKTMSIKGVLCPTFRSTRGSMMMENSILISRTRIRGGLYQKTRSVFEILTV